MVEQAKVTDTLEWGTIEHLVKHQIPLLLRQLTEKACDLDEQDGDEVWVTGEFLADVANALDACQEQFRAIRPYLREAVGVEAVARHGRESLWDTLPEVAKQRHLEAARDVIAAAGFTPVHSAIERESVDLWAGAKAMHAAGYTNDLGERDGFIQEEYLDQARACAEAWDLKWRKSSDV